MLPDRLSEFPQGLFREMAAGLTGVWADAVDGQHVDTAGLVQFMFRCQHKRSPPQAFLHFTACPPQMSENPVGGESLFFVRLSFDFQQSEEILEQRSIHRLEHDPITPLKQNVLSVHPSDVFLPSETQGISLPFESLQ